MKMDIISYLLELLETRKTVGITDLGTLYIKKTPGRYDADLHAFLPPRHEIAYKAEVVEETTLVNFISEKTNETTEMASNHLAEFVSNIKAELAEHQYADFSPLGAFKVINGQTIFESSKNFQIGFDFYGLPNIDSNEDEKPIVEEVTPAPLEDPIWKPTVNDRYEYEDDEDEENSGRGKRIFLKTLLILFIIAIAAAVVYFFYPNLLNNFTQNHQDQQIENAAVVPVDTNTLQLADTTADTTTFTPPVIEKDTIPTNTITYEVIGSAMKSKKKVEEVIGNFKRRGINAKAIDALPGRLIKISLGTFEDYNLAKKFQDSLKIKLKNPEIYIQTIKPKN